MKQTDKIIDDSFSADGDLQKKYNDYLMEHPASDISFADWKKQYTAGKIKKGVEIGKGVFGALKDVFGKKGKETSTYETPSATSNKILGMPKGVAIFIGITTVVGIGFLIYQVAKPKKAVA